MPTVTIGTNEYEVYADVATADEWLAGDISAEPWRAADDDTKARSLVTSTRWIDSQQWKGAKVDENQPLAWPRVIEGTDPVATLAVVTNASILLASMLVANPALFEQTTGTGAEETKRLKAGSVEIEYFRNLSSFRSRSRIFPPAIFAALSQWLLGADSKMVAGSQSYDTCRESRFKYPYGFTQGFS